MSVYSPHFACNIIGYSLFIIVAFNIHIYHIAINNIQQSNTQKHVLNIYSSLSHIEIKMIRSDDLLLMTSRTDIPFHRIRCSLIAHALIRVYTNSHSFMRSRFIRYFGRDQEVHVSNGLTTWTTTTTTTREHEITINTDSTFYKVCGLPG